MTWVRWFRADGNSIRLCIWRCIGSVLTEIAPVWMLGLLEKQWVRSGEQREWREQKGTEDTPA
jgi:hypothetical protein